MHKTIGIIGGLSPESTVSYYLHITRSYVERYGDYGYPEIVIYSVNLETYHRWRAAGRWDLIAANLASAARRLQDAGAAFGLIATNTMHKVFEQVQAAVALPLIHIIDATAARAKALGYTRLGLLGTRYTMHDGFYQARLAASGLEAIVPSPGDQVAVHRVIVEELVRGCLRDASRAEYVRVIDSLADRGAQAVILGCTEIPLLIKPADSSLPLLDTAVIHAEAALARALEA